MNKNSTKVILFGLMLSVIFAVEPLEAQDSAVEIEGTTYPTWGASGYLENVNGPWFFDALIIGWYAGKSPGNAIAYGNTGTSLVSPFYIQLDYGSPTVYFDLVNLTTILRRYRAEAGHNTLEEREDVSYIYNVYLDYDSAVQNFNNLRFCDAKGTLGSYIKDNFVDRPKDGTFRFARTLEQQLAKEIAVRHGKPSHSPWTPTLILSDLTKFVGHGTNASENSDAIYFCKNFTVDQKNLSGINGGLLYMLANITLAFQGVYSGGDPSTDAVGATGWMLTHVEQNGDHLTEYTTYLTALLECTKLIYSFTRYYTASYDTKHVIEPYYTQSSTNAVLPWAALDPALQNLSVTIVDQLYGIQAANVPTPASY